MRFIAVATLIIAATIFLTLPRNVSENNTSNYQPSSITSEQKGNDTLVGLSPEGWTAIFTVVLAISTVGLWIVTWRSAGISSRAAGAAEQLVKNEAIANRPHIIIDHLKIANILKANVSDGFIEPYMECRAYNRGKSPALLIEYSAVFSKMVELDPTPDYGTPLKQSYIIAPTFWIGVNRVFKQLATLEQARDICSKKIGLWLVVRIIYKDVFDTRHTMRAAYRLLFNDDGSFDTFIPDGPEAYWEYT